MSTNEVLEAQLYKHEGKLESLERRIADLEWAQHHRPKVKHDSHVLASDITKALFRLNLIREHEGDAVFDLIHNMLESHANG